MKNLPLLLVLASTLLSGCSQFKFPISADNPNSVVRIKIYKNKPVVDRKCVRIAPGDYLILAGPTNFSAFFTSSDTRFPNNRFSDGENKYSTTEAVINLTAPNGENDTHCPCRTKKDKACYKYDIIANGVVLDPHLVIIDQ